jgi:23S rRNA (cytidine1920-2'-O)/16S rRNA (cytidine1409-2'-O)-methyltransferase
LHDPPDYPGEKRGRERIDKLLVERDLAESRQKAGRLVEAGLVSADGCRVGKPAARVDPHAEIRVDGTDCPYVSRGGLKLEAALRGFGIAVSGRIALDIGASTGGFTDCLLQHGARKVYAVDVGSGQLARKLREDARVVSLEKTDARRIPPGSIPEKADVACVDVSFISVEKVLPGLTPFLAPGARVVVLLKPQFERTGKEVGGKPVVRDPAQHRRVLLRFGGFAREAGFRILGVLPSPVRGAEGNLEFLVLLDLSAVSADGTDREGISEKAYPALVDALVAGRIPSG